MKVGEGGRQSPVSGMWSVLASLANLLDSRFTHCPHSEQQATVGLPKFRSLFGDAGSDLDAAAT